MTAAPIEWACVYAGRYYPQTSLTVKLMMYVRESLQTLDASTVRFVRLPGGAWLACHPNEWFWMRLSFYGAWEPESTAFVRRWLRPGDTVLDIGAYNGYFTCIAAEIVGDHGRVHAFEPNPRAYDLLKRSLEKNGYRDRVVGNSFAIGARHGDRAILYLPPTSWRSGESSLVPFEWLSKGRQVEVPIVTLDQYAAQHQIRNVRFMKLDVEGTESEALAGGSNFLQNTRPEAILCEVQPNEFEPDAPRALLRTFAEHRYRPYMLNRHGSLIPYTEASLAERGENLCFLPDSI